MPDKDRKMSIVFLSDLMATEKLAQKIAPHLSKGDVLALSGELGTGKTEFARALLRALGMTGDVPSPTFTLMQSYDINGLLISHFYLYRLKSSDELDELGWDDALADGVVLVEWPERAGKRVPPENLSLHFTLAAGGTRKCAIDAPEKWATLL